MAISLRNSFMLGFLQAQVLTQLEESDVMRQSLIEKHCTLQQQLAQVQVHLTLAKATHMEHELV